MQKTLAVNYALCRMTVGLPDAIVQVCSIFKLVTISCITLFMNMEKNIHYHCKRSLKQIQINTDK